MEPLNKFVFPLFVRLDDGSVGQIESYDKILYKLEVVDIENDEFLFWDANGNGVKVLIDHGKLNGLRAVENVGTVQEAISEYAKQLGITVDAGGTPQDAWATLQEAKRLLPPRRGLLSRIFGGRTK